MAALAAAMSSTSSVEAPAAIIASAASMRFCFASCAFAFWLRRSALGCQGARGLKRVSMDLFPLEPTLLQSALPAAFGDAEGAAAELAEPPAWTLKAFFRCSFMGSCNRHPNRRRPSARCRLIFLSTDMSRSTFCITRPRVNSMSNAVALQKASWNNGMQSLKASAISASSPPGAHWPSSLGPPSPGGGPVAEADGPEEDVVPFMPKSGEASRTTRFSRLSFLRPTSGRI
mmetsp:Transcript_107536/g.347001  ORF Transcript_107536/g.347001 Transcript_107536/m.347001 type:complete len:230 (+) Transcript_107536:287-976(+)